MTTAVETAQRADRFPGGRVVAGGFIILAVSSGLGFYGLAVYLNAFSNERGWPVASISLATTLYFIVGGLAGLVVARMIARRDVRIPIVIGGILGGLSLAVLGRVEERWQLYLVYAVFAFGFAGAGLIPVTTVVTRWYHARRSVALSVASTGLSAGGILLTPAAKWLIDDRGLEAATPILGAVWVVGIVPIALWFVRPDPAALGWMPDGERVRVDVPVVPPTGTPFHEAMRSRFFIAVTAAYVLVLGAQVGGIQQLVKLVEDRTDARTAALATIGLAGTSVVARLVGGRVVVARADGPFHRRAGRGAVRGAGGPGVRRFDGGDLRRDPAVRGDGRQHPDAPTAADGRALRRPRLPAHLQPRPVHRHGRHGRRAAAARAGCTTTPAATRRPTSSPRRAR